MATLNTGFVQSLEFLKNSWNLPSNFPLLEKVWKTVKSLEFVYFLFQNYNKCFRSEVFSVLVESYSISPVRLLHTIQKAFFLCFLSLLINYLITLSVQKEITVSFRSKVSKKPLILDPKICTNPSNSRCSIFGKIGDSEQCIERFQSRDFASANLWEQKKVFA